MGVLTSNLRSGTTLHWNHRRGDAHEITVGRAVAACAHPAAAWRLLPGAWRWWIVVGYAVLGYTVTLTALWLRS